ncbi:MAG: Wzz/FepE/Etk N-terminal domain-containing protein [Desulfobacterales bacterium]|nr:Wzz/FepE/Etk N-terminal domain-containing protein [Desulfobacterales bacterium]
MDAQLEIQDLKGVIRRRKKSFLIPFLLIFLFAGGVAFMLPPVYRSESMILIEGQQIPEDYVKATITSYVEESLQVIKQQVMSRAKLLSIIEQLNLYSEMREKHTTEEMVDKMRKDIELKTISASVVDRRSGRPSAATIAFTLSYQGKEPSKAQKVANVLASFFLEEDLRRREDLASVTTDFLEQESEGLKKQIHVLENKISEFKKAHIGELPEFSNVNLQAIARLESEVARTIERIGTLKEQKIYLKGQLVSVDPLNPIVTEQGKVTRNPKERLKALRLQLISLQSALSEKHPDIKKLKNEIKELEAQVGKSDDSVAKVRRLSELEGQLAALKGKLGPKHPDVIRLSREVIVLSKEVDELLTEKSKTEVSDEKPDNPAYINLMTRIAAMELEIESLLEERRKIEQRMGEYESRLERAPLVEKEYLELTRDYENAKRKHSEIVSKLLTARISQGMEQTQRGERFTIAEPAQLPEKPFKPNRMAIALIGFVLALGAGVGLAAVREAVDRSVKTADELNSITGVPVFSVISLMETDEERRSRLIRRILLIATAIGVIVAALILVNKFVMPLDVIWAKVQRRLAMMELPF